MSSRKTEGDAHSLLPSAHGETEGKLVRDLIPEIIRCSGREPLTYVASEEEYRRRLRSRLLEEIDEFLMA